MLIKIGLSKGFVVAMWTLERLLIRLNALVLDEGALPRELIATPAALDGTSARVSELL